MTQNRKPTIDIVVNNSRGNHLNTWINKTILFNASGTFDIDNDTLHFLWDFDDGTNSTDQVVTHSYSEKGTYHVTLTVTDGELEDTKKITVTVKQKG